MSGLSLPPLFHGLATAGADPLTVACAEARAGCDAGLVAYDLRPDRLRAAIAFAPEVPLKEAAIMLPLCGVGFQNALGALAPPEVAVHLEWDGTIRVNGGRCGALTMAASPPDPAHEPDWLVIGLTLDLWPAEEETGHTPDVTALFTEGCADVEAPLLLEAWVRHSLVWINRWQEDGARPVHTEWSGIVHGLKSEVSVAGKTGVFIGVDEGFGMILQSAEGTTIIPLTALLEEIS
jgi:biotin-(acetyl-CoA carboxylase) ligase